jgi:peptidyl-prolyl cis-trans isomerase-like 3
VIDGWEALSSIERTPCNEKNRPLNDVRIENLTIHANPLADQMIIFPTATGAPDIQL